VRADVNASATEADVFASDNRGFYISITLYIYLSIYIHKKASRWARGPKCVPR